MSRREPRGKQEGEGDPKQPKVKRPKIPRQSSPGVLDRKEKRIERHERQCKRKAGKLAKRIRQLEDLLGIKHGHLQHLSPGAQHKRLWRRARLAGLVGPPLKKRARKQEKPQSEKSTEEHAADQADEVDDGKTP